MNGLLHRLAATATGRGLSVRSNARLPYSDAALGWADAAGAIAASSLTPGQPPPAAPSVSIPPRADGTPMPLLPQPVQPTVDPMSRPPRPGRARPRPAMEDLPTSLAAVNAAPMQDAAASGIEPPVQPLSKRLVFARTESPTARTPAGPAEAQSERSDPNPSGAAPADPDRYVKAAPVQPRARADPAPLLPQAAPRAITSTAPASSTASAPGIVRPPVLQAGVADEGTEVHIHIGRIEVTAEHAAAPPRRKAVPTPPPMSLDDYFARRGRA